MPGEQDGLRARLRVAVKAPLVAATVGGLYATWRALRRPARLVGADARLRGAMFTAWARASTRILGVRVRAEGAPPRGPCLLVANHLGYLDIAVLQARHDCTFVSMADVQDWPVMGRIARELGTVFVDRDRRQDAARAARDIEAALRAGRTVVLFPEGRAGDGREVRPFRSALLDPAARLGAPVAWAALRYETPPGAPPAADIVCWTDDASFGAHLLRLMRLPRIEARIAYGGAPITDDDRKRLARRLEEAVRARLPVG
ncbi:MAG: 1-acyl-sn-glycerol-3-phosphate acyltransferase [Planctomycetes bacterium]|nr:1-acyl-sn-glycerol-3-phosphate acyltransferase [Planctomycetota bacterium]